MAKTKKKLTPANVAEQMLSHLDNIDWGYCNGMGTCQMHVSARQVIAWCEALNYPIPEGTVEHARDAK